MKPGLPNHDVPQAATSPAGRVEAKAPSLDKARSVMQKLGMAGVDAAKISLSGPAAAEAHAQSETATPDRRALWFLVPRMGAFVVAGALAGLLLGALMVPLFGDAGSASHYLVFGLSGASGFGIAAGLIGGVLLVQPGEDWELTFHDTSRDATYVRVDTEDREEQERAEYILRSENLAGIKRTPR